MNTHFKKFAGVVMACSLILFSAGPIAFAATNLIANADLETPDVAGTSPVGWSTGMFGTHNAIFSYPVAGPGGAADKAAQIAITSYTSGDAKWYFEPVSITPGALYSFSDSYNSGVTTYLVAQFTFADNSVQYSTIATVPPSGGSWSTVTQEFTAPSNVSTVTIFHVLQSTGQLGVDKYSLSLSVPADQNVFSKGMVSLSFDDGWFDQYSNALPILQSNGQTGTFYIITNGALNTPENDIFVDEAGTIVTATTTTQTVWSQVYTDPTNPSYRFADTYTATGPSQVVVSYTLPNNTASSTIIGALPAATNSTKGFNFTLPTLATSTPVTLTHTIVTSGTLSTKNPSLVEFTDYMNKTQVLAMQSAGNEIGAHTQNHCDLAKLIDTPDQAVNLCALTPPAGDTAAQEVLGSKNALLGIGANPVNAFAYPYGSFNSTVENLVASSTLTSARSLVIGYNTKSTDKYALQVQIVDAATTFPMVQSWIDSALANKLWLVLVFHQIEDQATLTKNGDTGGTTPEILQQISDYLHAQSASVVTVSQGAAQLGITPPPTTGSLAVTVQSVSGNGTFSFAGDAGSFQVTTAGGSASTTIGSLTPGAYSVTQPTLPSGWTETSNTCQNIAVSAGQAASCVITNTFSAPSDVPHMPVANPVAGTYVAPISVSLTSASSTQIRYSTNNVLPTCSSGSIYNGAFSVATSTTVTAIGCNQTASSSVASFAYVLTAPAVNHAPVITASSTATGTVGSPVSFPVTISDPDSDPLVISSNLPSGAAFDTGTGIFAWTPTEATTTSASFSAFDGHSTTTQSVLLTIAEAPAVIPPAPAPVSSGGSGGGGGGGGGFQVNSTLAGTVFNDANADGIKESNELPLPSVTVYLDSNDNGKLDAGESSAITDASGQYAFHTLYNGVYNVRHILPQGWSLISPSQVNEGKYSVTLSNSVSGIANLNFADNSGTVSVGQGQVAGAFTSIPSSAVGTLLMCPATYTKDLYYGIRNNSAQVKSLQTFLNGYENAKLPITGYYGVLTRFAVKTFQQKNLNQLSPKKVTGNVTGSTRDLLNNLNCSLVK